MANLILAHRNYIDDSGVVDTGTSEAIGYERDHLFGNFRSPSYTWRSTGTTDQNLQFDLGTARSLTCFALWNHNLRSTADVRVQGSNSATYSPTVFSQTYNNELLDSNFDWSNAPDAEHRFWFKTVTATTAARYWRFTIYDSGNPDGYFEVGRAWFGIYWTPAANMDYGYQINWEDPSELGRSHGSQLLVQPRTLYRAATLNLSYLSNTESEEILDIKALSGRSKDVILSAYPGEASVRERQNSILGHLVGFGANTHSRFSLTSVSMNIEESP